MTFKSIDNLKCEILAIIDDKYLIFSIEEIMYASKLENNKISPIEQDEVYKKIIDIISKTKAMKQNLINYGFIEYKNKKIKVIFDTTLEKKYFYELKDKYEEIAIEDFSDEKDYIVKIIDGITIRIFKELKNTFSTKKIKCDEIINLNLTEGIKIKDFQNFNNGMREQIIEENEKIKDQDYKSNKFKTERNYIKLLMEILGSEYLLEAYRLSNDKILINELTKYINICKAYKLIKFNEESEEIMKELYLKKYNNYLENDLICMSYLDSIHNKNEAGFKGITNLLSIDVEKFYIVDDLVSEYAYITHYMEDEEKITILHDSNRRTNRYRKK